MNDAEPFVLTPIDRLRFMVIDDDRAMLELIDAMLRMVGVGSVMKAANCLTALNVLADQRKKVDCIICDHSMPNMTGLQLLQEIRAARYAHVPRDIAFIMITAHGQEAVVKAAINLDVSGYIVKPLRKDALIKAIHRAFAKPIALKPPEDYSGVALPPDDA